MMTMRIKCIRRRLLAYFYHHLLPLLMIIIIIISQVIAIADAADSNNNEVSMGTTILALRYQHGVIVGADTRTSVSGYVSNRYAAKLTFVLDRNVDNFVMKRSRRYYDNDDDDDSHQSSLLQTSSATATTTTTADSNDNDNDTTASTCVICRSGSAADTQQITSLIRSELVSRQILYQISGTVTTVASLLRNIIVENNGDLSASLICAGYDHVLGRGVIYTIGSSGTIFEERDWAVGGSGSMYILGHLDSSFASAASAAEASGDRNDNELPPLPLPTEEEGIEFVTKAITLAMERDGSSGGFIRMYVIDRNGKRFISKIPGGSMVAGSKEEESRMKQGESTLRNFAPAMISPPSSSSSSATIK